MRVLMAVIAAAAVGCSAGQSSSERTPTPTMSEIAEAIRSNKPDSNVLLIGRDVLKEDTLELDKDTHQFWSRYAARDGFVWVALHSAEKGGGIDPSSIQFSQSGKRE